jgi:hypothetical protein
MEKVYILGKHQERAAAPPTCRPVQGGYQSYKSYKSNLRCGSGNNTGPTYGISL